MLAWAEHGYRIPVGRVDTHCGHIERTLSAAIAAFKPDGMVLTPPHSSNPLIFYLLAQAGIGCARSGSLVPGHGFRLTMDDGGASRSPTHRLVDLRHHRTAHRRTRRS